MALIKREYTDGETLITAKNLNDIQDAIIMLEGGLFTIDSDAKGEAITVTDAANRGFRGLNIYGKTTQNGTPTPDNPVELVSVQRTLYGRLRGVIAAHGIYNDSHFSTSSFIWSITAKDRWDNSAFFRRFPLTLWSRGGMMPKLIFIGWNWVMD